jgi:hypothetical protein
MGTFSNQLARLLVILAAGCAGLALVAASAAAAPPQTPPGQAVAAGAGEGSPDSSTGSVPAAPASTGPQTEPASAEAPTATPAPAPAASPSAPSAPETGATTDAAAPADQAPDLATTGSATGHAIDTSLPAPDLAQKAAAPSLQAPAAPAIDPPATPHSDLTASATAVLGSATREVGIPQGVDVTPPVDGPAPMIAPGNAGALNPGSLSGPGASGSDPGHPPISPEAVLPRGVELSAIAAAILQSPVALSTVLSPSDSSAMAPAGGSSPTRAPTDAPSPGAPSDGGSLSGFFFFGIAALLLGLLGLAAPALGRRLQGIPASWRPAPYLSLLERPG